MDNQECMLMDENLIIENTSRVIRAGRKLLGLTQEEFSKLIGVNQSTLSKLESKVQAPRAITWINICRVLNIGPDYSIHNGVINNVNKIVPNLYRSNSFKLPRKYQSPEIIKVRDLLPLIKKFYTLGLKEKWINYLSNKKINKDIFVVLDFQLSLNILLDFLEEGTDFNQQINKLKVIDGGFCEAYISEKSNDTINSIESYIDAQSFFNEILEYKVTKNADFTHVSVSKKRNINFFKRPSFDIFYDYKIESLKHFIKKRNNQTSIDVVLEKQYSKQLKFRH